MRTIKNIALILLIMIGLNQTQVIAQSDNSELTFSKSQIINASADDVWDRLRKLDGLEEIVPDFLGDSWLIGNAKPAVGTKRSCAAPGTPKGQASYTEQVVEYDDEKRFYSYAVIEGIPAKNMLNSFKVVDLGFKKCIVIWESKGAQFIENPNMTKQQFAGFMDQASSAMLTGLVRLHDGK